MQGKAWWFPHSERLQPRCWTSSPTWIAMPEGCWRQLSPGTLTCPSLRKLLGLLPVDSLLRVHLKLGCCRSKMKELAGCHIDNFWTSLSDVAGSHSLRTIRLDNNLHFPAFLLTLAEMYKDPIRPHRECILDDFVIRAVQSLATSNIYNNSTCYPELPSLTSQKLPATPGIITTNA